MENKITVKDVLMDVNKILNDITVPISMIESIGIPVAKAVNGINICLEAFDNQENQNAIEAQEEITDIVEEAHTDE